VTIVNCFNSVSDALLSQGHPPATLETADRIVLIFSCAATEGSLWTDNLLRDSFVAPICPGHPQDWPAPV